MVPGCVIREEVPFSLVAPVCGPMRHRGGKLVGSEMDVDLYQKCLVDCISFLALP